MEVQEENRGGAERTSLIFNSNTWAFNYTVQQMLGKYFLHPRNLFRHSTLGKFVLGDGVEQVSTSFSFPSKLYNLKNQFKIFEIYFA